MDLSIIIVSYNTKKLTLECIHSIIEHTEGVRYEIVVVDNNSGDGTVPALKKINTKKENAKLEIIENKENIGFGPANNQGMTIAKGKYILLLNSDTRLLENSLDKLVRWMNAHPKAGAISCEIINPPDKLQANGGDFPDLFRTFLWQTFVSDIPGVTNILGSYHYTPGIPLMSALYKKEHQQDWVDGACFLVRSEVFNQTKGFDVHIFMYTEEVEWSYRIRQKGWEIWYVPITKILHYGGASTDSKEVVHFAGVAIGKENAIVSEVKGLEYFYKKHYSKWQLPIFNLFVKLGALLRILLFGVLSKQKAARRIYWHVFRLS